MPFKEATETELSNVLKRKRKKKRKKKARVALQVKKSKERRKSRPSFVEGVDFSEDFTALPVGKENPFPPFSDMARFSATPLNVGNALFTIHCGNLRTLKKTKLGF